MEGHGDPGWAHSSSCKGGKCAARPADLPSKPQTPILEPLEPTPGHLVHCSLREPAAVFTSASLRLKRLLVTKILRIISKMCAGLWPQKVGGRVWLRGKVAEGAVKKT